MGADQAVRYLSIENFLPNLEQYRAEVLSHPFYDVWSGAELFRNIQVRDAKEHSELLASVTGRKIGRAFNWCVSSPFHKDAKPRIHTDEDLGDVEAVLFLNQPPGCEGGMALWRHRATGLERRPSAHDLRRLGRSANRVLNQLWEDGRDISKWEMIEEVTMRENRLVMYPADMFHSRWPLEGFGTTKENSRLIWVSFFRWGEPEAESDVRPSLLLGLSVGRGAIAA